MGFFDKLKSGLTKTRNQLKTAFIKLDEDLYEELEEILIMSDVGADTSSFIITKLRETVRDEGITDPDTARQAVKNIVKSMLKADTIMPEDGKQHVILVIGVNGVGKTTSIGKLANFYKSQNKSVIVAAADTFRAAAVGQLEIWAERADVQIIRQKKGTDPAAVVFDAVNAAKARGTDVLICDTAGRLHNKKNLMDELSKMAKIITREMPDAVLEVLLVLDATTGQNALSQAKLFNEATRIDGIVLTKLDGTAKGGIVIEIKARQDIPVKFAGVGEQIDDLLPFSTTEFVDALFD